MYTNGLTTGSATMRWIMVCSFMLSYFGNRYCQGFTTQVASYQMLRNKVRSSALGASKKPSLIVFDLDNTLWTPELYQLRKLQRNNQLPKAHRDVKLFPAIQSILEGIREQRANNDSNNEWANTRFAVASRTKSVEWAHYLLDQFDLMGTVFDHVEIFPGNKQKHFRNLQQATGVEYQDMLFFDDARDGKFGNCEPVSELGVLSVHCPNGIYEEQIWKNALDRYSEWDQKPNTIIEWDGSMTSTSASSSNNRVFASISSSSSPQKRTAVQGERVQGIVKMINVEKRYGFIQPSSTQKSQNNSNKQGDVFFHFNALALPELESSIQKGDAVSFEVVPDAKNQGRKMAAAEVLIEGLGSNNSTVTLPVFSMNLPFAALLANGYKTLETRNGTMFVPYPEGTHMLLHVGQRTYPDGNRHLQVMKEQGGITSEEEIVRLKSLPNGFGKGQVVAIVELGDTFDTTLEERCQPDFEARVAAYGTDSGRRATVIQRASFLKRPVRVKGQAGVFSATIDKSVLPEGWLE